MKYVMLEFKLGGCLVRYPIIFPENLVHAEVAKHMAHMMRRTVNGIGGITTVSAGQVRLDGCFCSGKSESLGGLSSKGKEDSGHIEMIDYTAGIVP